MKERIKRLILFITEDIWKITDNEVSKNRSFLYRIIKTITLAVRRFTLDRIGSKASALTYRTLLSVIPLLAILFAIAKGFGFSELVEDELRHGLEGQPATVDLILNLINSYLAHTKSGVFIGVGLVLLLWTVINLTANIERTFNEIWQIKKQRSIYRKVTDYFSMFLLLPILIVLSGGLSIFMSTTVQSLTDYVLLAPILKFLVKLVPFVVTWIMISGLYVFMPNTKVKYKYALLAAIIVGTAYQFFQYFYISGQIWVSKYNAIYGSFAALPLFLLWLQASWTIILLGVEINYISQNLNDFNFEKESENISRRYRDFLSILILSLICKRFEKSLPPYTSHELSQSHKIPIRLTNQILYQLQELGLIHEVIDEEKNQSIGYLPSMDINHLSVATFLEKLDSYGSEDFKVDTENEFQGAWTTLLKAREEYLNSSSKILLKDL